MDKPLRVLLIEDSEDDAVLILRELRKAGYTPVSERVETESTMKSALSSQQWDIILSDYNMPEFCAAEALSVYRECGIEVPFIIVSGAVGEEKAVQLMKEGAHDYVMKDNLQRLVPAIERELKESEDRKSRKIAEDSYRKSDFIVNASRDMMALINRSGIFETVNSSFCKIFGKERQQEIVGHSVSEIWGQEVYEQKIKPCLERCQNGEDINTEDWFDMEGMGTQCLEISYIPYRNSNGVVTHAIMAAHNITNRKMAEQELDKSYRNLQKTLEETVNALSALVEMRDPYTA
ncbi:MAG TPA: PAS domain S-box protein, partial [Rectinema sp.]|nr:PAS domain S-box protein [Rectinema sp.]